MSLTTILLLAFILNLAVALGAGLYETKIILPLWFHRQANNTYHVDVNAMRTIDSGRKFWGLVTTLPLTLLTIANLWFACKSDAPLYNWWLSAGLVILLERISTFSFFIPTAIALQKGAPITAVKAGRMAQWWIRLNYVCNLFTLTGLLLCLKALIVYASL